MELHEKRCEPCDRGTPRLGPDRVAELLERVGPWDVVDERLRRTAAFDDFRAAMAFVNAMAELAEGEGHHPDFCVHFNRVDITVWTHAIGGLSENDFVLAAKIDRLLEP